MVKSHVALIDAARTLSDALRNLRFSNPVKHIYDPLEYARAAHEIYLSRFGGGMKKIIFLGMNPGPFGMAQTGVPFGEIAAVRDWMGIRAAVGKPAREHLKRPIRGFDCDKSEVSGRRLWGLFAQRYGAAVDFFKDNFVANFCPLVFMSESGANITPDKVSAPEMEPVFAACDVHLRRVVEILQPDWLIGVGGFAEGRAKLLQPHFPNLKIARILHPSPASPAANKDWAGNVTRTMEGLGIWKRGSMAHTKAQRHEGRWETEIPPAVL